MAESMSSPWIRDYLVDTAERYGAQLYNAPLSSIKKKVQLTDFLTYQENSYVWAWISDKDYRVSVRISKDAAVAYKSQHGRNIIDCRFSVVFISNYRPMFSPRPLGPNTTGNTPVSHISLEIGHVKSVGIGGHLFGNPHDLESDENVKEWVQGLRQDGGGGNVLKLRKQQELAQNEKCHPSPPSPPPFSLYAPVSQCQPTKVSTDTAKPKPEQNHDFKRAYTKRWRTIEVNLWKLAAKPVTKSPSDLYATSHRTLSPTSTPQRQGTPTDWSLSNRGSPVAPDEEVLPTTPRLAPDTEGPATTDTAITPDIRSLQPPTPAQRAKRSSPLHSTPPRSSPGAIARSSPLPSEQLPCSSSPPPSSSLPPPLSSLPISLNIRKNIQRKVPHPGIPSVRPVPTGQGPVQILVPDSDASGAASSQSNSQSQQPSQSQQSQRQLLSRVPALPSSLAKDFKPLDSSTPREGTPGSSKRRTSKMLAETSPARCGVAEQEATSPDNKSSPENPETNTGQREGSSSTRPPAPSAPKIEVLEVGTSDTEEEADQLQLTCNAARTEADVDAQIKAQDKGKMVTDADPKDNHSSVDKAEAHSAPRSSPPRQPSDRPTVSDQQQTPKHPGSQSPMHSLFSDSLDDKRTVSPLASIPLVDRKEDKTHEESAPASAPSHDVEAWKEPSFLARRRAKGKARAVEEPDADALSIKVGKKRRRSVQPESPARRRTKAATSQVRRVAPEEIDTTEMQPQDREAPAGSSKRSSTSPTDTTETTVTPTAFQPSKPRLANFLVSFRRVDLGKRVEIPMVDAEKDIESILLKTGRIRTLGDEVEADGSIYIKK